MSPTARPVDAVVYGGSNATLRGPDGQIAPVWPGSSAGGSLRRVTGGIWAKSATADPGSLRGPGCAALIRWSSSRRSQLPPSPPPATTTTKSRSKTRRSRQSFRTSSSPAAPSPPATPTRRSLPASTCRPRKACDTLISQPSCLFPDRMRIVPGRPEDSFFFHKLTGEGLNEAPTGNCGGAQTNLLMPFGASELPDSELALVHDWIAAGATCTGTGGSRPSTWAPRSRRSPRAPTRRSPAR